MNLKESYRYANYLNSLLAEAYSYLRDKEFVTTKKQNHLRSKANAEAQDEVIDVPKPYDVEFTPNDLIDFAVKVISEKESLANAITDAKSKTEVNIDNAIAMNKKKQEFVHVLNSLAGIKPGEKKTNSSDYKFNADGNQVPYFYTVLQTTSIDFNRNDVRALSKKLMKEADEVSSKLDAIEINTILDFEPKFDVNSTFEECVLA